MVQTIRDLIRLVENATDRPAELLAHKVSAANLPARVTVHPLDATTAEVTGLEASVPGQGQGRATMQAIIAMADELGVTLELWPVVDWVDGGLSDDALERWYARLGFEPVLNRDPDETDLEWDRYVVRKPTS